MRSLTQEIGGTAAGRVAAFTSCDHVKIALLQGASSSRPCNLCVVQIQGDLHRSCFLQLDPKEIAKARARAVKAEAKAAQVAKETRGMKKMSAFFTKPQPAAKAAA